MHKRSENTYTTKSEMASARTGRMRGLACGSREAVAATRESGRIMMCARVPGKSRQYQSQRLALGNRCKPARSVTTAALKGKATSHHITYFHIVL